MPCPVIKAECDSESESEDASVSNPAAMDTSMASVSSAHSASSPTAHHTNMSPPPSPKNASKRRFTVSDSEDESSEPKIKEEKTSNSNNTYTLRATGGLKIVIKNSPLYMKSPTYDLKLEEDRSQPYVKLEPLDIKHEKLTLKKCVKARDQSALNNKVKEDITDDVTTVESRVPFEAYISDDDADDMTSSHGENFTSFESGAVMDTKVPPGGGYTSSQDEGEMSEADTAVAGLLSSSWQDTSQEDVFNSSAEGASFGTGDFDTGSEVPVTNTPTIIPVPQIADTSMLSPSSDSSDNDELSNAVGSLVADLMDSYPPKPMNPNTDHVTDMSQSGDFMTRDLGHLTAAEFNFLQSEKSDFDNEEFGADNLNVEMQSAIDSILSLQNPLGGIPNSGSENVFLRRNVMGLDMNTYTASLGAATAADTQADNCNNDYDDDDDDEDNNDDDDGDDGDQDNDLEAAVQSILM